MQNKRIFFITIVLTLMSLYGIIHLHSAEKDYNTIPYDTWKTFSEREQLIYVIGYIHGSFTVTETIIKDLESEENTFLRDYVTQYYNHDIVVAVNWIYEEPYFRSLPVYNVINNLDEYLRLRKKLYDEKYNKEK